MTILPWRMSSTSSSMLLSRAAPLGSGFKVKPLAAKNFSDVLAALEESQTLGGLIAQQQALQVTPGKQVHFQVHPATRLVLDASDGFAQGVGNDGSFKLAPFTAFTVRPVPSTVIEPLCDVLGQPGAKSTCTR